MNILVILSCFIAGLLAGFRLSMVASKAAVKYIVTEMIKQGVIKGEE